MTHKRTSRPSNKHTREVSGFALVPAESSTSYTIMTCPHNGGVGFARPMTAQELATSRYTDGWIVQDSIGRSLGYLMDWGSPGEARWTFSNFRHPAFSYTGLANEMEGHLLTGRSCVAVLSEVGAWSASADRLNARNLARAS